jgi:hypothetical protein
LPVSAGIVEGRSNFIDGTAPLACRRFAHLVALVRAGPQFQNGVLVE